jgi:hypothetical protein
VTASYTYDGDDLLTVRRGSVELTQTAELGGVGSGRLVLNDVAGTLAVVGQKDFAADQDACTDPISYRGFVASRTYSRGPNSEGASREIEMKLEDLNAMLGFRLIDASDGNRPAETVAARGAWLMASDYVTGLFTDEGRCDFPADKGMTKADYRSQYPGDVLADMALAS